MDNKDPESLLQIVWLLNIWSHQRLREEVKWGEASEFTKQRAGSTSLTNDVTVSIGQSHKCAKHTLTSDLRVSWRWHPDRTSFLSHISFNESTLETQNGIPDICPIRLLPCDEEAGLHCCWSDVVRNNPPHSLCLNPLNYSDPQPDKIWKVKWIMRSFKMWQSTKHELNNKIYNIQTRGRRPPGVQEKRRAHGGFTAELLS